jgi:hypothetical protein
MIELTQYRLMPPPRIEKYAAAIARFDCFAPSTLQNSTAYYRVQPESPKPWALIEDDLFRELCDGLTLCCASCL